MTAMKRDKYGSIWPQEMEVCPECGQPDNCGDCSHERLDDEEVWDLGGVPRLFDPNKIIKSE